MELLWNRVLNEYYAVHKTPGRYNKITTSMFWGDDLGDNLSSKKVKFPKLKGKAYEVKVLMPALVWLWDQYRVEGDAQHDEVALLLQCSVHMDTLLDTNELEDVLPPIDAHQFMHAGFSLNACMNSLMTYFGALGLALFNITPKNHYLAHIALSAKYFNPRRAWCYAGEDMMRHIRRMGGACARGSPPALVSVKMMEYYLHAVSFSIARHTGWWRH